MKHVNAMWGVALVLALAAVGAQAQDSKIGYINTQRITSTSEDRSPKFTPWFQAMRRFSQGSITSMACTSGRFSA